MPADPDAPDAAARTETVPLLRGRTNQDGRAAAYVCENRTCHEPLTTASTLKSLIAEA